MWFKRWVVLISMIILPCYVGAMDNKPYDSSLVNKEVDSDNPAIIGGTDGNVQPQPDTDSKGFIKGLNQDDLAKKLLNSTDHLQRWRPRQKVALVVAIIAVCTSLGLGAYIIYDKIFTPKEECSCDGHDMPDQVLPESRADED